MSGLEIIGLAASVLQIADYGWKTSYKLYAFSKKVHGAGKTIELISQDISATGAVLKQLGDRVEKDVTATPDSRICSHGLITAASKLVEECKNLFTDINISIGGKDGNKVILGFKQKLKWSYLEPRIELLRANLERLKSSLAIMLNVLIYAEQLRSREERTVLTEQQGLVASFASQKADAEKSIEQLSKSVETGLCLDDESRPMERKGTQGLAALPRSGDVNLGPWHTARAEDTVFKSPMRPTIQFGGPEPVSSITGNTNSSTNAINMFSVPQSKSVAGMTASTASESKSPPLSGLPLLEQHRSLIEKILEEVNSSRYAIDHGLRYRLHDGILDLHWDEWSPLRSQYGDHVLRALLTHSPVLARHWHERLLNETNNKKRKDKESDNDPAINLARPTYIRVHTKYLSSATLEHYSLPWEYDRQDPDYIIIKEYINHELQEDLFDHTKNLKNRELPLSQEAISADISSSKTRSQKQPMLKPIPNMELEYLDPDDVVKANHTPVLEAMRLRYPSEETLPPLVLEDEPESPVVSNMGRGKRAIGRTRPSQCDAVLIGQLDHNRPEIVAHAGEYALNSGLQSEAESTSSKDYGFSQTTAHVAMSMVCKATDEPRARVLSPETLAHDLRTPRTSHKIAEQGQRSRINTALEEIKALLPEEIMTEGNNAKNGFSAPGASKASTVEMAIAYIKNLQAELESSRQHFLCNIPGCCKAFHRLDLLQRHLERHDLEAAEEASGDRSQSSLFSTSSDHMSMYPEMAEMAMSMQASLNIPPGAKIMWSGSQPSASQRERISPLVANRKRKGKSSGLKIRGQNLDGDVIQRHTKRQKTRQRTLHVESDEVLRREDETTDVDENLSPEPGNAADIADYFLAQWTNVSLAAAE